MLALPVAVDGEGFEVRDPDLQAVNLESDHLSMGRHRNAVRGVGSQQQEPHRLWM
jgi:hypothetical protein